MIPTTTIMRELEAIQILLEQAEADNQLAKRRLKKLLDNLAY